MQTELEEQEAVRRQTCKPLLHKVRAPMRSLVIFGACTVPQCPCAAVLWFWALPSVDCELQACPVPGVCCVWLGIHWKSCSKLLGSVSLDQPAECRCVLRAALLSLGSSGAVCTVLHLLEMSVALKTAASDWGTNYC